MSAIKLFERLFAVAQNDDVVAAVVSAAEWGRTAAGDGGSYKVVSVQNRVS